MGLALKRVKLSYQYCEYLAKKRTTYSFPIQIIWDLVSIGRILTDFSLLPNRACDFHRTRLSPHTAFTAHGFHRQLPIVFVNG